MDLFSAQNQKVMKENKKEYYWRKNLANHPDKKLVGNANNSKVTRYKHNRIVYVH